MIFAVTSSLEAAVIPLFAIARPVCCNVSVSMFIIETLSVWAYSVILSLHIVNAESLTLVSVVEILCCAHVIVTKNLLWCELNIIVIK